MTLSMKNPYEPPSATTVDQPAARTQLRRRSVVIVVLLSIGTLGVYVYYWMYRYSTDINRLHPSATGIPFWFIILAISAPSLLVGLACLQVLLPQVHLPSNLFFVFNLFANCILLIWVLWLRVLLNTLTNSQAPISILLTILLSIFYLQYRINQLTPSNLPDSK